MGLKYENLDDDTRSLMIEEIKKSITDGSLYLSNRLSEIGRRDWPGMLLSAAKEGSDETLCKELSVNDCIVKLEARRKRDDFATETVTVPVTAGETLSESEFNRYYMKALCRRAVRDGVQIVVYRAKDVLNPRPDSDAKVGVIFDPETLLKSLSAGGVESSLGLSPRPGSGLTVKLV